ncbi:hypothetical protein VTK56DRAFT_2111 [Thermocarpiscus australiensis]
MQSVPRQELPSRAVGSRWGLRERARHRSGFRKRGRAGQGNMKLTSSARGILNGEVETVQPPQQGFEPLQLSSITSFCQQSFSYPFFDASAKCLITVTQPPDFGSAWNRRGKGLERRRLHRTTSQSCSYTHMGLAIEEPRFCASMRACFLTEHVPI